MASAGNNKRGVADFRRPTIRPRPMRIRRRRAEQGTGRVGELRCFTHLEAFDPRDAGDSGCQPRADCNGVDQRRAAQQPSGCGRASAIRPAPTWATAQRMNSRANCGCSACTPAAAAWMTPAPIDVMAAIVKPGTRVVDRPDGVRGGVDERRLDDVAVTRHGKSHGGIVRGAGNDCGIARTIQRQA